MSTLDDINNSIQKYNNEIKQYHDSIKTNMDIIYKQLQNTQGFFKNKSKIRFDGDTLKAIQCVE